ncbi:queuosine precursor transporter [Bartonella sp. C271]|uniref:queuosine precursor transporter n=1 Tax=Bartonella sp. C271 TaxID=3070220 RepID=UPI0038B5966A
MSSTYKSLAVQKERNYLFFASFAMCVAVVASNILVQYPVGLFDLDALLTYGAFTYPFSFLINDLTNRFYGPDAARRVVYVGFISAAFISWILATPRLAIASSTAFLFGQLLDIIVFTPLRRKTWWKAPLIAALVGSALDTILFFSLAFASSFSFIDQLVDYSDSSIIDSIIVIGIEIPVWFSLAFGDFSIKIIMSLFMLVPYGIILRSFRTPFYQGR